MIFITELTGIRGHIAELVQNEQKFRNKLGSINSTALKQIRKFAETNFNDSIERPQEKDNRPDERETGNFTFGQGGAFKGIIVPFRGGSRMGFGYPDVEQADAATNRVWRALEYGLGDYQSDDPFAPVGDFRLPRKMYFRDTSGEIVPPKHGRSEDILFPGGGGSRVASGGIRPKWFIRDAWESVIPGVEASYDIAYSDFDRDNDRS